MPPSYPPLPPLPQPTREVFDPFNSTSTGHQHADSSISSSTSWRASRTHKLSHQLRDITGSGGARHISHLVGASSEDFSRDGRKGNGDWDKNTPGLRGDACRDIRDMMQGTRKRGSEGTVESSTSKKKATTTTTVERKDGGGQGTSEGLQDWQGKLSTDETLISTAKSDPQLRKALGWSTVVATEKSDDGGPSTTPPPRIPDPPPPPQIFSGLNIYLNGSTLPHISDHKLKHLLAQHGANISIALGRRTVTHVILSDKGRLAAGKIQKEVTKIGGKGVKFVSVRWVLDSIEKGRRQPESRYEVVRLAMKGQRSVLGMGIGNLDRGEERNDE
jgi:BRCT domain, a BRCA1 C-terminus domain